VTTPPPNEVWKDNTFCDILSSVIERIYDGWPLATLFLGNKSMRDYCEDEIKKLIDKYSDKSLEEPEYYFQYVEIIEDLQSLFRRTAKSDCPSYLFKENKNG